MKIDTVGSSMYAGTVPFQQISADETNSSLDDFDDTRIAVTAPALKNDKTMPLSKQISIEELMGIQASTEKMAHSYGFSSIDQAANISSNNSSSNSNFALNA